MRRIPLLLILVLTLSWSLPVLGYDVLDHTWSDSSIKWALHPSGSGDVSFTELENAMKAAFQEFQKLSCFPKTFSYQGTSSANPKNGIYVRFVESNWDPTVGDAAAYAQTWTTWGGSAEYSVIVFNGQDLTWTTTEATDFFSLKTDIQGVGTHELGHCLGLAHSRVRAATMFFSGGSTELRTLDQDDKNGICYLYSNFTQGQPCDACSSDNHCASGYCLQYPDGATYCGKNCTSDSNCADHYYCYDLDGATDQCVATNGYCNQTGGNIPVGSFCYGHETCEDGLCMVLPDEAYCSKECTSDSQCPNWMKCISGLCLVGGSTPLGGECDFHTDCESGMCIGLSNTLAVCTLSCLEGTDCPDGFACYSGYCLESDAKDYGAVCDSSTECKSGSCISVGAGKKICTEQCDSSQNCPDKDPCTYGICIPPGNGPFGTDCTWHTECQEGWCAGMSAKFCSMPCDSDADCPDKAVCASGGYCVPLQDPSDMCQSTADCAYGEFCHQVAPDTAGSCTVECNPFADAGCEDSYDCRWTYQSWLNEIFGRCVETNGGGMQGDSCHPVDNPCLASLYCANIGGTGQRCYRDCNLEDGFGCKSYETCLALGISSDPLHGVCFCNDPSCEQEEPVEPDILDEPTEDVVSPPADTGSGTVPEADTGGSPSTPSTPSDDSGNSSSGGCTSQPGPASPLLFLLLLATLVAWRREA